MVKKVRNSNEVSFEGLLQGVYMLRIADAEGRIHFVHQRSNSSLLFPSNQIRQINKLLYRELLGALVEDLVVDDVGAE